MLSGAQECRGPIRSSARRVARDGRILSETEARQTWGSRTRTKPEGMPEERTNPTSMGKTALYLFRSECLLLLAKKSLDAMTRALAQHLKLRPYQQRRPGEGFCLGHGSAARCRATELTRCTGDPIFVIQLPIGVVTNSGLVRFQP